MFSENLKKLRERDELPQIRFAKEIGFSQAAVSAWENNTREPGIEALIKIARYFNVSVDFLIEGKKNSIPTQKKAELSPDAKELLDIFNTLDPLHQKQILGYVQGFAKFAHPNKYSK